MAKSVYLYSGRKGKYGALTLTEYPSWMELQKKSYMGAGTGWATYKGYTIEEVIKYLNRINKSLNYKITNLKTVGKKRIAKVKATKKR